MKNKHKNGELTFCSKDQISKRKHCSDVWGKFRIIKCDNIKIPNFVYCSTCGSFCAYNGNTTSRLISHKCSVNTDVNQNTIEQLSGFDVVPMKKPKINFSSDDLRIVRDASSKFIVNDLRPFYAIEGNGLISLAQSILHISKKYPNIGPADIEAILPSRNTLRTHLTNSVQAVREKITFELKKSLQYPGEFAISVDLWKDNYRGNSYAGVIAHTNIEENNKFVRKSFVCCVKEVPELTKDNRSIREHVESEFEKYDVPREIFQKKVKRITDRGLNVAIALEQGNEIRLNCYAHLINNIVGKMCKVECISEIIKDAGALVKYMKTSGLNAKLAHTLKSHVTTRWNTVYYLLQSICKNYDEIQALLSQKERETRKYTYLEKITSLNPRHLKMVVEFLKLFKDITKSLEGDKRLTLHNVWLAYNMISDHLIYYDEDEYVIAEMKKQGRDYITANMKDILPKMEHKLACFLHPQLKSLTFASLTDRIAIQSEAEKRMEVYANETMLTRAEPTSNSPVNHSTNKKSLFSSFMDCAQTNDPDTVVFALHLQSEIHNYLLFNVMAVRNSC